jgi:CRP-like cAMP-binding protein
MTGAVRARDTIEPLRKYCQARRFNAGDVLRQKDHYYKDMYVIADGCVAVSFPIDNSSKGLLLGRGSPVGEIGFLRGCPATATVLAQTDTEAIVIDDAALARLELEEPALATKLLRHLAETAEERISHNLTHVSKRGDFTNPRAVAVYLCRNDEMFESAKRLRYEVYCQELGRNSPHADHDKKIITDELDKCGHTFIAVEDGETIGTIRGNLAKEGPVGVLQELYGMTLSPHHPENTSIVTKFIVKKSKRGGPASFKLISALTSFGVSRNMKECYIDSIPSLLHYYKAIGFKMVAPKFFHLENGPSYPMKLDLTTHGQWLCKETTRLTQLHVYVKAQAIRLIDQLRDRLFLRSATE